MQLALKLLMSTAIFGLGLVGAVVCGLLPRQLPWGSSILEAVELAEQEPRFVFDDLVQPQPVQGWTREGLKLENGTLQVLPGIGELSLESAFLSEATSRGVEIAAGDARVYGLLPLWPTCHSPPVTVYVTRVDLAHFLEFLADGSEAGGAYLSESSSNRGGSKTTYYYYDDWYYYEAWLEKTAFKKR